MEDQKAPSLVKVATKYGLIDGVLGFLVFVVVAMTGITQNWLSTSVSVLLLVVLMVLAHREFKKTHEGVMTYGQGLGIGTLLAVVASVLAAILLYIYVGYINPGYPEAALQAQRAALEQRGVTGVQLEQGLGMVRRMLTPTGMFVSSLLSGAVIGFICALIVSIFTRVNDPRAVI
jgi:hypothetical protein